MNKQNRNRFVNTENTLMIARWEGVWRLGEKDEEIKSYKIGTGR